MATTVFGDHLLTGDHASRPAAADVPQGSLYSCTTHGLVYQSDGVSSWATWATITGGTPGAHAASHQNGGGDEISVAGLSGALADPQPTTLAQISDATAFGRSLVDDADAAAGRTTLGLGSAALLVTDTDGTLAANSDSNAATQKATKTYVDNKVQGLTFKQSVRAATTVAGTLASSFENGDAIDGVTLATGDRILVKDQASGAENGIYTVNASGAPTRATDADAGAELVNATMLVQEGTTNADQLWSCTTNAPITLGSTALAFAQVSGGATGETNTASNVGGEKEVFKTKTGVDLVFRTLKAGTNITLTQNTNDIEIEATSSGGTSPASDDLLAKWAVPGSPNAQDDEFDGSSSATWTDINTPVYTTDANSNVHTVTATDAKRLRVQTAPGTPYTVVCAMTTYHAGNNATPGMWFRQSSTGKLYVFSFTAIADVFVAHYSGTGSGTFVAVDFGATGSLCRARFIWMAITDDGTNLIFRYSPDGVRWIFAAQFARGGYMTGGPDQFGIGDNGVDNAGDVRFHHVRVTAAAAP